NGWTINTCGSTLAYPYIHLLKADKTHFKSSHVSVDGASCTNMNGMVENISLPAGTYYLVTEGAGTATGTIRVNIGFCYARPTSVEENTGSELDLQVFPNPFSTSTTIKITGSQQEKVSVEIISVNGARVYKNENHAVGEEITLGENFPAGIYFVKMNAGNEMKTVKLVKLQ
ncbi:MAG TPA: T9SS type A sorting domain-containing protein, partial [Bacteroidia bacterium]|nr:T9SS type A sorting domain-containing protein [Bacteroidia bacterium]